MNLTINAEKPNELLAEKSAWSAVRIWMKAGRSRMNNCMLEWKKGLKSWPLWRHSSEKQQARLWERFALGDGPKH
jgi:hypothetical protein